MRNRHITVGPPTAAAGSPHEPIDSHCVPVAVYPGEVPAPMVVEMRYVPTELISRVRSQQRARRPRASTSASACLPAEPATKLTLRDDIPACQGRCGCGGYGKLHPHTTHQISCFLDLLPPPSLVVPITLSPGPSPIRSIAIPRLVDPGGPGGQAVYGVHPHTDRRPSPPRPLVTLLPLPTEQHDDPRCPRV